MPGEGWNIALNRGDGFPERRGRMETWTGQTVPIGPCSEQHPRSTLLAATKDISQSIQSCSQVLSLGTKVFQHPQRRGAKHQSRFLERTAGTDCFRNG